MMTFAFRHALLLALAVATSSHAAHASAISFTGNLRTDATVTACGTGCTLGPGNTDADYAAYAAVITSFNVATTSTLQAITFSFGGGTNGAGSVIAPGGLEPYLSLFDNAGNFLASTYFGTTCPAGANSYGGNCYDVLLDGGVLAPGTYQIALTAYFNQSFAENLGTGTLADGFTGLGNLAPGEDLHYAFDVDLNSTTPPPPPTPVPEPAPFALVGLTASALSFFNQRLRTRRNA